jgi:hypothetical protein
MYYQNAKEQELENSRTRELEIQVGGGYAATSAD